MAFEPLVPLTVTVVDFELGEPIGKPLVGVQRNLLASPFGWLRLGNSHPFVVLTNSSNLLLTVVEYFDQK
jgi:hypothetical protein